MNSEAKKLVKMLKIYFQDVRSYFDDTFYVAFSKSSQIQLSLWTNRVWVWKKQVIFKEMTPLRDESQGEIDYEAFPSDNSSENEYWGKIKLELTTASETFKKILQTIEIL